MTARRKPARRKSTRSPVRRPRRVLNPRPIPLDDTAIEALLDRLYYRLGEKAEQYGSAKANPDGPPVAIAQSSIIVTTVRGQAEKVAVVLTAAPGVIQFVGGGGYGHAEGRPVVIVEMNGLYSWNVLADERVTRDLLRHVLRHEITHAVDTRGAASATLRGGARRGLALPRDEDFENLAAYYNDPREVRAYMRQMFDETRAHVTKIMRSPLGREWGLGGTVSRLLNTNETWEQVSPHLTPRNRRRVLAGLVRAFQDDGL